jgi:glycyl-tRNA synthetase beta chain
MADFLLELACEEIPARMQPKAKEDLAWLFAEALAKAGLSPASLETFATSRRLALIATGLPLATAPVSEETKGPKVGAPPQALDGFLRKVGLSADQLTTRDGVYFAVVEKPGRDTAGVLAEAIPAIIRAFPWPKSMRWGAASITTDSIRWVRPLSGIIALLDGEVVPCAIDGIASGRTTMGHRFHHSDPVVITDAASYVETLRAAYVIVHFSERCQRIRDGAARVAGEAGLTLVADEGLVIENAGLTEWPVPLLGRFDEAFLTVPPEVIQLTARVNQKYFVCEKPSGGLANAFICTANIDAINPAVVVDGNRKVLAARLADARFFWEQDQKKTLAEHAKGLQRITFHEKLGTVAHKVERVAKLARWLCEERIVAGDPALAEQAARLAKADLDTEMVGEFPELQGLMGGYYAAKEGLPQEVSEAIRDHYKPVGQGDEVPTAPVTVAVSLADKFDTLFGFFSIDEKPTGSKDPFALRRAGLGILALIQKNNLRIDAKEVFTEIGAVFIARAAFAGGWRSNLNENDARKQLGEAIFQASRHLAAEVTFFLQDRLIQQQRDFGVRGDLIRAGFEGLGRVDDFISLLARVHALQAFVTTDDGDNLLAGYKRAANILKKEGFTAGEGAQELSYTPEPAEKALIDALTAAAPRAAEAVEAERFADAMAALATLRAPIDRFFEEVTVNAEEADKRSRRLALLARFRDAVHRVADFSRIEG